MKLVTSQEMREIDKKAVEDFHIPGIVLMDNAGKAVADAAAAMLRELGKNRAAVLCGKGNNGGDGFCAARWLQIYGFKVKVFLIGFTMQEAVGDAAAELAMLERGGADITAVTAGEDVQFAEIACLKNDLIIDAMLGTGFSGELRGLYKDVCKMVNGLGKKVLAIDVPTGVNADDGTADCDAVRADVTVTMELVKTGLLLYPGAEAAGKIISAQIGVPLKLTEDCSGKKYLVTRKITRDLLPVRRANAHKGDAGRVVIAAGSPGFVGAAALASNAAVKTGAGLVSLLTPLSSREVLAVKLTEVMVHGLLERMPGVLGGGAAADITRYAEKADVLAIGPGLGVSESTLEVIREVLKKTTTPVVIDADALTALCGHTDILTQMQAPKVLTPHAGELARILEKTPEEIERGKAAIAAECAERWNAAVVIKGMPTVIALPGGSVYFNITGCSAMATGGSGDVLTGVIAALIAQGISVGEAAVCGTYLHGIAGELASERRIGLAAGEISQAVPKARELTENGETAEDYIYNTALKMIK